MVNSSYRPAAGRGGLFCAPGVQWNGREPSAEYQDLVPALDPVVSYRLIKISGLCIRAGPS